MKFDADAADKHNIDDASDDIEQDTSEFEHGSPPVLLLLITLMKSHHLILSMNWLYFFLN